MLDITSSSIYIDMGTVLKCPPVWDLTSRFFCISIHTKWQLPQEVVMQITELWFPEFQLNSLTNLFSDKPFLFITFVLTNLLLAVSLLCKNQVSYLPLHSPFQLLCYLPFDFRVLHCSHTCSLHSFLWELHLHLFLFFLKRYLSPRGNEWLFCSSPPFCSVALICSCASNYLKFTGTFWSHASITPSLWCWSALCSIRWVFSPLCRENL